MPMRPIELKKAGREVFFVSRESGMLRSLPGLGEIQSFQSFRRKEVGRMSVRCLGRTCDICQWYVSEGRVL